MFNMGPVLARDNDHGVSGAEPECTARYRELIVCPNGIGYRRSHINKPKVIPGRNNRRSRGVSTLHGIPGGRQVIPQVCGHA